jgi:two-component system chemotaxis response regulator CheY
MSIAQIPFEDFQVLIVEDEALVRKQIKRMLHKIGVTWIWEAADGKAGLDEVMRRRPHLVLCDVYMEPVDGRTFLKLLRHSPDVSIHMTPVVFLTADANLDTVMFAKEHAINGYLVKPVSMAALKAHVDAILKPQQSGAA